MHTTIRNPMHKQPAGSPGGPLSASTEPAQARPASTAAKAATIRGPHPEAARAAVAADFGSLF